MYLRDDGSLDPEAAHRISEALGVFAAHSLAAQGL
jgi:hypothetical protein